MNARHRPAPINLIVGTESFLAERRRIAIVNQARKASGNPDLPFELRKAKDITDADLLDLLSPSLFAEDRIVAISDLDTAGKETIALIEGAIKDPVEGVVLILLHSGGGRNKKLVQDWAKLGAEVFQADKMKANDLRRFVMQEFKQHATTVGSEVVEHLIDGVGTDPRELASAVSQLVADTDGKVGIPEVRRYYSGKAEVSGFDIADRAVAGNVSEALALTRRAIQLGVAPVLIASAVSNTVADIAKIAGTRVNARRDAGELGMAPWKIEKVQRQARSWTPAKIAAATQVVAALDAGVKGQSFDASFALEHAVHRVAEIAAGR